MSLSLKGYPIHPSGKDFVRPQMGTKMLFKIINVFICVLCFQRLNGGLDLAAVVPKHISIMDLDMWWHNLTFHYF